MTNLAAALDEISHLWRCERDGRACLDSIGRALSSLYTIKNTDPGVVAATHILRAALQNLSRTLNSKPSNGLAILDAIARRPMRDLTAMAAVRDVLGVVHITGQPDDVDADCRLIDAVCNDLNDWQSDLQAKAKLAAVEPSAPDERAPRAEWEHYRRQLA